MYSALRVPFSPGTEISHAKGKFRLLSAITVGRLTLAVVAITASSGTSRTATHAALAAQIESFPPVNLDDCPTL
jgi:hypothetical protein